MQFQISTDSIVRLKHGSPCFLILPPTPIDSSSPFIYYSSSSGFLPVHKVVMK